MTKAHLFSAIASSLAMTGAASAQTFGEEDTGFYLGGGYSYLDFQADDFDDAGDSVNAFTARLGYQITPNIAIEGDASFGFDNGDFDFDDDEDDFDFGNPDDEGDGNLAETLLFPGEIEIDYLAAIFARYNVPVTDRFDVHARGGFAYVEADSTVEVPVTGDDVEGVFNDDNDTREVAVAGGAESGFAIGAGASYDLTESWILRADYTLYAFDDADINAGTVAVEYKF